MSGKGNDRGGYFLFFRVKTERYKVDWCENIKSLYLLFYVARRKIKSSVCLLFYALSSVFLPGGEKARVNQQPPGHHGGWSVSGQETLFCWVPVS
jgi:hypothetical protein